MTEGSDSELDPEDVTDVLRVIELYEDDEVCDSPIIVVEIGLDRATVDEVLDYLWRADRIECRVMRADGESMLTGIRRVVEGRERRWGEWGRYRGSAVGTGAEPEVRDGPVRTVGPVELRPEPGGRLYCP